MVTTTPTVPEPQTRRPLPPVRAGDPRLTDADPKDTDQQLLKLSHREVETLGGITTDGPCPPSFPIPGSAREPSTPTSTPCTSSTCTHTTSRGA
jgi:hypothetical protein